MRTSSLLVGLCLSVAAGGCKPSDQPSTTKLPDTPDVAAPQQRPSEVQFEPPRGEEAVSEKVRQLQGRVAEQNEKFRSRPPSKRVAQAPPNQPEAPAASRPPAQPRPLNQPPIGAGTEGTTSQPLPPLRPGEWPPVKPSPRPPVGRAVPERPLSEPPVKPEVPPAPPATEEKPSPQKPEVAVKTPVKTGVTQGNDGSREQSPPPDGSSSSSAIQKVEGHLTADDDPLRKLLLKRVADHPTDVGAHLNLQLFFLLKEEPVPQMEMLTPLPKEQRDTVVTVLNGLSNYRNEVQSDPNALPSRLVAPLLKMATQLSEQTELTIPTITLCETVTGFGIYNPMSTTFNAGREYETIIYCEIQNFSSQQNEGMWETKLSMEAVLYNSDGDAVLKGKDVVPTDRCRNRRHDFFVAKRLRLPASLAASKYILKVTIIDEQAKRVAESSLNIMMMAGQ